MATLIFRFVFLSNASPAVVLTSTELTGAAAPTINISSTAYSDGAIASVVSGGAMTYDSYTQSWSYRLAGADLASYVYVGAATTTYATASPATVHALGIVVPDELVSSRAASATALSNATWTDARAGKLDNLDGTVTSRLPTSGYTAPLTAAGTRAAVGLADADLDEQLAAIAASGLTADQVKTAVWTAASRTLTSTAAETTAAVAGGALAIASRATFAATLTGLTIPASWERIWLTIKRSADEEDAASQVQIVVSNPGVGTDGLLYLAGAVGTAAWGTLTVDQVAGTVAIWLADEATTRLSRRSGLVYDVKYLVAGDTTVLTSGAASVTVTPTAALA